MKLPSDHAAAVLRCNVGQAVDIFCGSSLKSIIPDFFVIAVKSQDGTDAEFQLSGRIDSFDSERLDRILADMSLNVNLKAILVRIPDGCVKRCVVFRFFFILFLQTNSFLVKP